MERYIAIIRKSDESDFGVEFPDVSGCFSAGSDLNEARAMAAEALRGHLDLLAEEGVAAPLASSASTIMARLAKDGAGDDFHGLLEIEAEAPRDKVLRVNISIEETLLGRIDAIAKRKHTTRSGYLAELARADIARQ